MTALAFAADGRTVYAGALVTGVFKSADGGRSWSLTGTPLRGTVQDLETDPSRAATVYAATSAGIWKSEDAGATWRDPFLHDTMYAATQGGLFILTQTTGP